MSRSIGVASSRSEFAPVAGAGGALARALVLTLALAPVGGALHAQVPTLPPRSAESVPPPVPTRGRLLYETHCIACHTTQMHWRDGRIARDWPGLVAQVRRWQGRASLEWSEADVLEVARHLNATIYRLPEPGPA